MIIVLGIVMIAGAAGLVLNNALTEQKAKDNSNSVLLELDRLVSYAEKLLQLEREIHLEVPESEEPSGILKLGVSESLCYNRLPEILMNYKKLYPKVDIRLTFIMHDTFPELLKKGELDMVYTLNPLITDDNLEMLYKNPESLGFYVSPGHTLAKMKRVTEDDLKGVPLLLTGHDCSFRQMLINDLVKAEINPDAALETSSKEILKQFAINELGVAFMPDMAAQAEVERGTLKKLSWSGNPFPVFSRNFRNASSAASIDDSNLLKSSVNPVTVVSISCRTPMPSPAQGGMPYSRARM